MNTNQRSSKRQAPPASRAAAAANEAPRRSAVAVLGSAECIVRLMGDVNRRKMSLHRLAAHYSLVLILAVVALGGRIEREELVVSAAFSPLPTFQSSDIRRAATFPGSRFHCSSMTSFLTATVSDKNENNESSSEMSISLSSVQGGPLLHEVDIAQDENSSSSSSRSGKDDDLFKVGAVVRPRYLDKTSATTAQQSLLQSTATSTEPSTILAPVKCMDESGETAATTTDVIREMRRRNTIVAIASIVLAISNYVYQFLHPLTPLQLLVDMQSHSSPITIIGKNPKPTVVDFWAPWCENCQRIAPALYELKQEYGNEINFVMINGDDPDAWPYLQALRVDAIPHLALVTADGIVQTALIGPVPKHILQEDLDAMVRNNKLSPMTYPLPHVMLDVFATTTSSSSSSSSSDTAGTDGVRDAEAAAAAALEARRVSF